jgi:hypothetical protein
VQRLAGGLFQDLASPTAKGPDLHAQPGRPNLRELALRVFGQPVGRHQDQRPRHAVAWMRLIDSRQQLPFQYEGIDIRQDSHEAPAAFAMRVQSRRIVVGGQSV